ncbi:hypothetical protein IAD21_04892 [Abditibacteriota bacterium]|nr:hypothetical protein IAD21_04892 [Abditibacteriota bacterium]
MTFCAKAELGQMQQEEIHSFDSKSSEKATFHLDSQNLRATLLLSN